MHNFSVNDSPKMQDFPFLGTQIFHLLTYIIYYKKTKTQGFQSSIFVQALNGRRSTDRYITHTKLLTLEFHCKCLVRCQLDVDVALSISKQTWINVFLWLIMSFRLNLQSQHYVSIKFNVELWLMTS